MRLLLLLVLLLLLLLSLLLLLLLLLVVVSCRHIISQDNDLCTWPKFLTPFEATAQWDIWILDPKAAGVYHCRIATADYVRVPTVYKVNIFNTMSRGKEVEGLVKTTKGKRLTEEGVMAEIGKLQLNHDRVGGSEFDINHYAQSMIKSAESGNAFASSDMLMDDVKKLVPENVERDDADDASHTGEAAAGAEDGQDVGEDEPLKKKAKKEVFVDMQKFILDKTTRA